VAVSCECGVANVRLLAHPRLLCYPDCDLLPERYCEGGREGGREGERKDEMEGSNRREGGRNEGRERVRE